MNNYQPAYINAYSRSVLQDKVRQAKSILTSCTLCPRQCKVDRTAGETGYCRTTDMAYVAGCDAHFGEEAPLVGRCGSGTIFFTHCNLLCTFCQNYDISHGGAGEAVTDRQLADMMIKLQHAGCHNINFVTPSHVVAQILAAVRLAVEDGLTIPLVYNTGGYDSVETLQLLDGVIDIYMPDFKFWDPQIARQTCDASDYRNVACRALIEMHRQVGDLTLDEQGLAQRGLIIRHLVLPESLAGTEQVMDFIAKKLSANTYVNIMPQYRPCANASEIKALSRSITDEEFQQAVNSARSLGIRRLDQPRRVFALW